MFLTCIALSCMDVNSDNVIILHYDELINPSIFTVVSPTYFHQDFEAIGIDKRGFKLRLEKAAKKLPSLPIETSIPVSCVPLIGCGTWTCILGNNFRM